MRRLLIIPILLFLIVSHVAALGKASLEVDALPRGEAGTYHFPGAFLKITSLEFDGLSSDFLFLNLMVTIGKNIEQRKLSHLPASEWERIADQLRTITDLDPYFADPYYIGNAYLPWYADMVQDANALLEKGSHYRAWDWTMPFFIGFNYFYFLQDNDTASQYLMEAARRPEASPTLASLAVKLAYKAKKTESSILFLEELIRKEEDKSTKELFKQRLETFQAIYLLEQAVHTYQVKYGRRPKTIDVLVQKGMLNEIPTDPYGGSFFLDDKGNVRTTSEAQLMPHLRKK